jgi:hypothetical protein
MNALWLFSHVRSGELLNKFRSIKSAEFPTLQNLILKRYCLMRHFAASENRAIKANIAITKDRIINNMKHDQKPDGLNTGALQTCLDIVPSPCVGYITF